MSLLEKVASLLTEKGYDIVNLDANIVAQQPILNPYVERMRNKLARSLWILDDQISVKPKTNEGVGAEGRGQAISAHAVVLIQKRG